MPFSRTPLVLAAALAFGAFALPESGSAQQASGADSGEEMRTYRVRSGDTCGGIAHRFYGNWRLYPIIPRYNPQLLQGSDENRPARRGRCGPFLRPGVVLNLPLRPPADMVQEEPAQRPDAEVTQVRRRVQARQPEASDWSSAERGLDLYRGWRVNTLERSAAELTFRDDSRVQMRQNTLVIIYGGASSQARRRTGQAQLERGALRSRLAELRLQVDTPSGQANIQGSDTLVAVDDEGTSRLSNFDGQAATLQSASGGQVRVRSGFGSKVRRGARPSRPRRLPPAPRWTAEGVQQFAGLQSQGGTVRGAWEPVEVARLYRVEILGDDGIVAATEVPATVTNFEVHRLPAGEYTARVSTIDNDHFESRPSTRLAMNVALVQLAPPGGEPDDSRPDPLSDPSEAPQTPQAMIGSTLHGLRCAVGDGEAAEPLTLSDTGNAPIRCTNAEGATLPPFTVAVARPELSPVDENGAPLRSLSLVAGETTRLPLRSQGTMAAPPMEVIADGVEGHIEEVDGERFLVLEAPEDYSGNTEVRLVPEGSEVAILTLPAEVAPAAEEQEVAEAEPDPEPEPAREEEPRPLVHQAFGLIPNVDMMGLRDDRRRGFTAAVAGGYYGTPDEERFVRLGALVEVPLGELRLGVAGVTDVAEDGMVPHERGDTNVSFFAGGHVLRTAHAGIYLEVGGWANSTTDGALDAPLLQPSLDLSWTPIELLSLRTRQGASISTGDRGNRSWQSAYGLDFHLHEAFTAGLEVDLGLGTGTDLAGERDFQALLAAGLGIAAQWRWFSLHLGARIAITDDARNRLGRINANAALRFEI